MQVATSDLLSWAYPVIIGGKLLSPRQGLALRLRPAQVVRARRGRYNTPSHGHQRPHPPADPARRRSRLPLARRAGPSARPGHRPVPQGPDAADPRQRRRVQLRRQPGRLLPPEDRRRHRDGRLPDRRPDRRARPGDGRPAVLQDVQARRGLRPEHGHRLQRPRPRRARAGRLLQPQQRSGGAAQAGRLRLEPASSARACAGSTAAASSRRSPKAPPR